MDENEGRGPRAKAGSQGRVRSAECGMRNAECGMRNAEGREAGAVFNKETKREIFPLAQRRRANMMGLEVMP